MKEQGDLTVAFDWGAVRMCMSLAAEVAGDGYTHSSVALALGVRVHILTARVEEEVQHMGYAVQARVGEYSRKGVSGLQRSCLALAAKMDSIAGEVAAAGMAVLDVVQSALGMGGLTEGMIVVLKVLAIERMVIDVAVATQRLEIHKDWAWARC